MSGVYDKSQATEIPRAYVVIKSGTDASSETASEIVSWMSSRVANHKRLRGGVKFVKEIPKTASGKILRRKLKAEAAEEEKAKPKL